MKSFAIFTGFFAFFLVAALCLSVGCAPEKVPEAPKTPEVPKAPEKTEVVPETPVETPAEIPESAVEIPESAEISDEDEFDSGIGAELESEDETKIELEIDTEIDPEIDAQTLKQYVEDDEFMSQKLELGDVLVDDPAALVRLDAEKAIWVDKDRREIVMQGWICQNRVALEFFVCYGVGYIRTMPYKDEAGMPEKLMQFNGAKCHESIISVDVPGNAIHAGLLAVGAEVGHPVQFVPEFKAPTGDEIQIIVRWKDKDGNLVEHPAQDLVLDVATEKPMDHPWVFAGSLFYTDDEGEQHYAADSEGELIGVSNFPSAILDVPFRSSTSNEELGFLANESVVPERGTPVTLILKKVEK